jgi:hypothetical protein
MRGVKRRKRSFGPSPPPTSYLLPPIFLPRRFALILETWLTSIRPFFYL